jgi:alpha-galactosidase
MVKNHFLHWILIPEGLCLEAFESLDARRISHQIIHHMEVSVEIDGKILQPSTWTRASEEMAIATIDGIDMELRLTSMPTQGKANSVSVRLINQKTSEVSLGAIRLTASANPSHPDFLATSGKHLRLYKEGWGMDTPAASVRFGEADFQLNPGYKDKKLPNPKEHEETMPNRFRAEYVTVLSDRESGMSLLLGFVTSAHQVTGFHVELEEHGVQLLEAYSLGDNVMIPSGEERRSEELVAMAGDDAWGLLEVFAEEWGKRMHALTWDHTPTGWCSWPYYGAQVSEVDMKENARWLGENRADFPIEYLQMDDGFQTALGDWLEPIQESFPSGLEQLAKEIQAAGIRPGLWVAPFLVEECSKLYAAHPDWMVKDHSGNTVWAITWRGVSRTAILDATIPAACAWLKETFATLSQWGFQYVKLDFLVNEAAVFLEGGVYSDRGATRVEAIRRGLQAIREGFGNQFILGCTNVLGSGVGLVNGCRIGSDIGAFWKEEGSQYKDTLTMPNVCRNIINRSYMNRRLWLNDPDTHIARIDRNTLSENEVRLWTTALWLVGGMLLLGDRFETLTPDRADLSRMLLKSPDAFDMVRPLDFLDAEFPMLWHATHRSEPDIHYLGIFNFDNHPKRFSIDLIKLGISPNQSVFLSEVWEKYEAIPSHGILETEVLPHSCRAFRIALIDPR